MSDTPQEKRRWAWRIGNAIVLLVLGWYVWVNRSTFADTLAQVDVRYLGLMVLLSCVSNWFTGYGITLVLRWAGASATVLQGVRLHVTGRLLGTLIPHSGNMYRAVQVYRWFSLSFSEVVGVLAANIWLISVTGFGLSMGLLLLVGETDTVLLGLDARVFMVLMTAAMLVAPWFMSQTVKIPLPKIAWIERVQDKVSRFTELLRRLAYSRSLLLRFVVLNVVLLVLMVLFFWCAFRSLGMESDVVNLCLLTVFLRLAASWNVTPGNVGVLELVAGYLTTSFGQGSEAGVLLVLEFRLVVFVAVALMAFCLNGRQVLSTLRKPSELENGLASGSESEVETRL